MLTGNKAAEGACVVPSDQIALVQGLIDAIPTPIYFRDADRTCLWCNKAFEKLIGMSKEDIVGREVDAILFADDLEATAMLDEVLVSLGGEQNFETIIRSAAGNAYSVTVFRTLYHDAVSGVQGIVVGVVDVTYRRQVEKSVNRALAILNGVLESAHDGFIAIQRVNNELVVVASNNTINQMFGLAEGLGQDMADLERMADSVLEPPDYWARFLRQATDGETLLHEEIGLRGGQIFEVYSQPFYHGIEVAGRVWNYRDITEERAIQARLKESNDRNQALWYQSSDCIFLFDPEGLRLLEANGKCLEKLGYSADDFLEKKITDIMDSDPEMVENDVHEVVSAGSRFLGPRQLRRFNGTLLHAEVATSVIIYQNTKAILVNARDISERVRLEDQILADVHLAAKVQRQFLPINLENEWARVEGIYTPHYSISGDIYSFLWDQDKLTLSGFLLDVSGHGIATSLLNAVLLPLAKEAMERKEPLHERVSWLNNQSLVWFGDGSFAVGIFFEIDFTCGVMTYVSAGIGFFLLAEQKSVKLVKAPGFMLGIWPQADYETECVSVKLGDAVFFVTDGISDLLLAGKLDAFPKEGFMRQVSFLHELACDKARQDDASGICIQIGKVVS